MAFPEYPDKIAKLLVEQWENIPRGIQQTPSACLPVSVLGTLLDICFFASLRREEGRVIQFDVALCPPSALQKPSFRSSRFVKTFNLMKFDKPQRLSIERLVRLAPACEPAKTLILVNYDESTAELQLWGLVDTGSGSVGETVSLTELRVRVFGPGHLGIRLRGRHLCTYNDGRIFHPEKALINSGCIYDFFRQTSLELSREVQSTPDGALFDLPINERDYRAMAYLRAVQELIERMQRLQHGGCILIVPEGTSPQDISDVNIKYQCRDESIWTCLKGGLILDDEYYRALELAKSRPVRPEEVADVKHEREDVAHGLRDSMDTLARFTAVDGAVIMTRKFELLGFGAVVHFQQTANYNVLRSSDRRAESTQKIVIEGYGTRHRSAFDFCYQHSPSVAVVVSQDGGVKMVTRMGDSVYFWEDSLFDVQETRYDFR